MRDFRLLPAGSSGQEALQVNGMGHLQAVIRSFSFLSYPKSFMRLRLLLVVPSIALLLLSCSEPQDNRPGQPVAHRQAAFKKILLTFEPMGIQLREGYHDASQFLEKAQELARLKNDPWQYFGPDTNYPPTRAKSRVWDDPAQFNNDKNVFLAAADALLVAAESKDESRVSKAYDTLHEACSTCHKSFKQ